MVREPYTGKSEATLYEQYGSVVEQYIDLFSEKIESLRKEDPDKIEKIGTDNEGILSTILSDYVNQKLKQTEIVPEKTRCQESPDIAEQTITSFLSSSSTSRLPSGQSPVPTIPKSKKSTAKATSVITEAKKRDNKEELKVPSNSVEYIPANSSISPLTTSKLPPMSTELKLKQPTAKPQSKTLLSIAKHSSLGSSSNSLDRARYTPINSSGSLTKQLFISPKPTLPPGRLPPLSSKPKLKQPAVRTKG
jgi:hypothetical protein